VFVHISCQHNMPKSPDEHQHQIHIYADWICSANRTTPWTLHSKLSRTTRVLRAAISKVAPKTAPQRWRRLPISSREDNSSSRRSPTPTAAWVSLVCLWALIAQLHCWAELVIV